MKRLWHWRLRRIDLQLGFCIALLGGIGLAHTGFHFPSAILLLAIGGWLLSLRRRNVATALAVVLLGFSLGGSRGALYCQQLTVNRDLSGQKISITARARDDAVYGTNSQLSFNADSPELAGVIHIGGFGLNSVFQGDEIEVSGKLQPGSGQYQGYISYAQLRFRRHHPTLIADIRRRFTGGMQTALPEPQASFAMGLLIGQRSTLPAAIKQDILAVGLTHIIAVSGYNLTIMLQAARRLLGTYSKRLSLLLCLSFIAIFLLITGSSASIVRAAVVSVLSLWASYYGRSFRPLNLILLAAAITAWLNPFYLWSDVSWYLSFLAFYGVLVVAPLIAARFHHAWQRSLLASVALESMCAELMAVPFIVYTFGQLSLIGLPANLLVVALIPLAMLLSLVAGLAGMLVPAVAGWLAWPAQWLLTYMLDIAHLLAAVPGVFRQHIGLSLWQMLVLYGLILLVTFVLMHQKSRVRAKITDKNQQGVRLERSQQMVNH